MTELLLREAIVDNTRLRDRLDDQNRTASIERELAVLQTKFAAWIERAVSGDDLKELKREMEAEVNKQIGHICDHFDSQMTQQSRELLNEFRTILTNEQLAQSKAILSANNETRKEIIRYGIGFALTVLSALVIFWFTRNIYGIVRLGK